MYLVLRAYVRSRAAAFVGGLLFGFSPYMLAEGRLHVFLVFLPLLPPLIPLIDRWLVRADRSPYRCGALIGLLLGLEMLISAELVAVFVIFAVIALVPLAIRHHDLVRSRCAAAGSRARGRRGRRVARRRLRHLDARCRATATNGAAALGRQPRQLPRGSALAGRPFASAAASAAALHDVGDQFVRGVVHENGFYLGIPLLILLIVGACRLRRHALVFSFATLGVISFVLGLGTRLTVANQVTAIPMPIAAITRVPLLQEIGPTRFALAIQLAASVLLALVLDRVLQRPALTGIRRPAALVALSLVVLVPLLPNGFIQSVPVQVPGYFSSSAVTEIPQGSDRASLPLSVLHGQRRDAVADREPHAVPHSRRRGLRAVTFSGQHQLPARRPPAQAMGRADSTRTCGQSSPTMASADSGATCGSRLGPSKLRRVTFGRRDGRTYERRARAMDSRADSERVRRPTSITMTCQFGSSPSQPEPAPLHPSTRRTGALVTFIHAARDHHGTTCPPGNASCLPADARAHPSRRARSTMLSGSSLRLVRAYGLRRRAR